MTDHDSDSDSDTTATDITRRRLLRGSTAAGLAGVGIGVPAVSRGVADQQITDPEHPHRVTLRPVNEGEQVSYRFRVDGTVAETESTGTLGYDMIETRTEGGTRTTFVEGMVGGTIEGNEDPEDAYQFAGNFVITEYDKPVEVTLELHGRTTRSDNGIGDISDAVQTGDESDADE